MEFYLYKGLKKPLVLFGLKDKYIYQALACAAFGIICLAALPSLIGWIGFLIGAAIILNRKTMRNYIFFLNALK